MENKTTLQEKKKEKWSIIKKELLNLTEDKFVIDVEGIEDESKYFHPVIIINDEVKIKSQGDISRDYCYAFYLYSKNIALDINDGELEYFLKNNSILVPKLEKAIKKIEMIKVMEEKLRQVREIILESSIKEIVDGHKIKHASRKLYEVIEFVENGNLK